MAFLVQVSYKTVSYKKSVYGIKKEKGYDQFRSLESQVGFLILPLFSTVIIVWTSFLPLLLADEIIQWTSFFYSAKISRSLLNCEYFLYAYLLVNWSFNANFGCPLIFDDKKYQVPWSGIRIKVLYSLALIWVNKKWIHSKNHVINLFGDRRKWDHRIHLLC